MNYKNIALLLLICVMVSIATLKGQTPFVDLMSAMPTQIASTSNNDLIIDMLAEVNANQDTNKTASKLVVQRDLQGTTCQLTQIDPWHLQLQLGSDILKEIIQIAHPGGEAERVVVITSIAMTPTLSTITFYRPGEPWSIDYNRSLQPRLSYKHFTKSPLSTEQTERWETLGNTLAISYKVIQSHPLKLNAQLHLSGIVSEEQKKELQPQLRTKKVTIALIGNHFQLVD